MFFFIYVQRSYRAWEYDYDCTAVRGCVENEWSVNVSSASLLYQQLSTIHWNNGSPWNLAATSAYVVSVSLRIAIAMNLSRGVKKVKERIAVNATPISQLTCRAVVVPERSGTPFRQIVLSRSGAPVNIVGHRRNANTVAFRQIS